MTYCKKALYFYKTSCDYYIICVLCKDLLKLCHVIDTCFTLSFPKLVFQMQLYAISVTVGLFRAPLCSIFPDRWGEISSACRQNVWGTQGTLQCSRLYGFSLEAEGLWLGRGLGMLPLTFDVPGCHRLAISWHLM